ncbi:MAG: MMPL family transporter [Ktedonobacterales bacterium]|nr:MMPL family transporter [Ktedonobacterales bacterium]
MATIIPEDAAVQHDATNAVRAPMDPPPTVPARPGFGMRYGYFIVRIRWVIIAFWAVILLGSLPFSAQVTKNLSSGGFSWSGSESINAGDIIGQKFTTPLPTLQVVFQSPDTAVSDTTYQAELQQFTSAAQRFPRVAKVTPGTVGQDGRTTYVTLEINASSSDAENTAGGLRSILPTGGPAKAYIAGEPAVFDQINNLTKTDLAQAEELTLPVAGVALLFVFGTLLAAAIPLGLALLAIPITLAIIFLISQNTEMSIYVVNIASVIGLGLSIDYSLFIVRRFRDELHAGRAIADAIAVTTATSGEAILFSGLTVLIGFSGLALVGLPFMTSMAIGGAVVVGTAVLGALTLVPAVLSLLGPRVFAQRIPRPWKRANVVGADAERAGFWQRWAMGVMARPWLVVTAVLIFLAVLTSPLFSLALGLPGTDVLPPTNEVRHGTDILAQQFPAEQANPTIVVVQTRDGSPILQPDNIHNLCQLTGRMAALPHIANVQALITSSQLSCEQAAAVFGTPAYQQNPQLAQLVASTTNGDTTLISITSTAKSDSADSKALVNDLRKLEPSALFAIKVGGLQAVSIDLAGYLYGNFPHALIFIFIATYIVLLIMFRSVLLPIKAVVMNVLSVAAAYGALVFVFQQGHFSDQLQFSSEGFIEMTTPILLFCILFGLSMDYEVFLLSRIREEWERTHDNRYAVARGLEKTAGVITSAALMIIIVCAGFMLTHLTLVKEQGLGIAAAVLVDASIIRILLVPATMRLLGKWNWWFPGRKTPEPTPTPTAS